MGRPFIFLSHLASSLSAIPRRLRCHRFVLFSKRSIARSAVFLNPYSEPFIAHSANDIQKTAEHVVSGLNRFEIGFVRCLGGD